MAGIEPLNSQAFGSIRCVSNTAPAIVRQSSAWSTGACCRGVQAVQSPTRGPGRPGCRGRAGPDSSAISRPRRCPATRSSIHRARSGMRDRTRATTSDFGERVVMPSARPVAVTSPCRTPLARTSAAATGSPCASRIEASAKIRCTTQSGSSARIHVNAAAPSGAMLEDRPTTSRSRTARCASTLTCARPARRGVLRQTICCSQARPSQCPAGPRQHCLQEAGDATPRRPAGCPRPWRGGAPRSASSSTNGTTGPKGAPSVRKDRRAGR